MILWIVLIIIGFVLLIKGADFLVTGASNVAKKFHIPEIIIGLTIVSIGTSMPELFVSVTSALNGHSDMAMGNVIGSNVCNLLLILGMSAVVNSITFKKETRLIEIPTYLLITVLFMFFCNTGLGISRIEGFILLLMFLVFIGYTIIIAKKEAVEEKNVKVEGSNLRNIIYIVLGIVALKCGGSLAVNNLVKVAQQFNISEKIISLTILAIGTSLPELVTSVMASLKKNSDIAIGNIIGSNIFNMLLIIGVSSVISPISYNASYNLDLTISLIGTMVLALFPLIPLRNQMSRGNGLVYLMGYACYLLFLISV